MKSHIKVLQKYPHGKVKTTYDIIK